MDLRNIPKILIPGLTGMNLLYPTASISRIHSDTPQVTEGPSMVEEE